MEVAKRHQDQLSRIKDQVKNAYEHFKPNYDRFNEFRRFVFESSLTGDEITLLMTLSRPQLEFNILEAYVSRLLGEFSKQEPSIIVATDNDNFTDPEMVRTVEGHLRHTLTDSSNHHVAYEVYKDLLSGGFSTFKITTEYAHPMSFNQVIKWERAFDPTMTGYDHLARYSHKGDGRFCFELFPMSKEEFEELYPDVDTKTISFRRDFAGFNWSYLNDNTEILIVADFYQKVKRRVKIVQLQDGKVIRYDKYKKMVDEWTDLLTPPPAYVGKPRVTELEHIERFRIIENQVIEHEDTDFTMFPLVFVDGNSILVKTPKNGNVRQVTRPYVYHARGAQRLKNFAGNSLANEIENTVQHKFMVKKEALPKEEEFLQAFKDVQKASVLVVNAFDEQHPDKPIPDPLREVARVPAPPEIFQGFSVADSLIQNILGSYDAALGINDNQLSGVAIVEGATQSNSAAMPYIVGYLQGLQRVAEIHIDLMPKYYTTPRTLPVKDIEGKPSYIRVNEPQGPELYYDENALNVKVEAGINFHVQQSKALAQIIGLMQASQQFAAFMNEKGLMILLDNIEIRGIEQIKDMAKGWMQEVAEQKKMMMQQQQEQMKNNPAMQKNQIEMARLEHDKEKSAKEAEVDSARIKGELIRALADMRNTKENNALKREEIQLKREELHSKEHREHKDMGHRHMHEALRLHHDVQQAKKENKHGSNNRPSQ
jgi:hypothetical protein